MPRTKGATNKLSLRIKHATMIAIIQEGLIQGKPLYKICDENNFPPATVYRLIDKGYIDYQYKIKSNELKPEGTATQTP